MTDLERFFVQLVRNVAAADRSRLGKPLFLVEIRNSILPYRSNRRALQLESSEEYELLLMRLVAGEGGFARTGPDEVHDEFVRQLASPHPDLTIVQQHENAIVHLDPQAVAKALDPKPELAYAPPAPIPDSPQILPSNAPAPPSSRAASQSKEVKNRPLRCSRCGSGLPTGRLVKFCPQCGQSLTRPTCSECKTELEPEWRHCVNCGTAVALPEGP